jgi:hypothetical protein
MAKKLNQAQRLLASIGLAVESDPKHAHGSKNASATKAGAGRYHRAGEPGNRLTKPRPQRAYVALMAAWASKRITKTELRDEHGAYTCVGSTYEVEGMAPDTDREHVTSSWVHGDDMGYTARRKWLAGVSAQRGH